MSSSDDASPHRPSPEGESANLGPESTAPAEISGGPDEAAIVNKSRQSRRRRHWLRQALIMLIGALLVLLTVPFWPLTRYVLAEKISSAVNLPCEIGGIRWSGLERVILDRVVIGQPGGASHIEIRRTELPLKWSELLKGRVSIHEATVSGIHCRLTPPAPAPPPVAGSASPPLASSGTAPAVADRPDPTLAMTEGGGNSSSIVPGQPIPPPPTSPTLADAAATAPSSSTPAVGTEPQGPGAPGSPAMASGQPGVSGTPSAAAPGSSPVTPATTATTGQQTPPALVPGPLYQKGRISLGGLKVTDAAISFHSRQSGAELAAVSDIALYLPGRGQEGSAQVQRLRLGGEAIDGTASCRLLTDGFSLLIDNGLIFAPATDESPAPTPPEAPTQPPQSAEGVFRGQLFLKAQGRPFLVEGRWEPTLARLIKGMPLALKQKLPRPWTAQAHSTKGRILAQGQAHGLLSSIKAAEIITKVEGKEISLPGAGLGVQASATNGDIILRDAYLHCAASNGILHILDASAMTDQGGLRATGAAHISGQINLAARLCVTRASAEAMAAKQQGLPSTEQLTWLTIPVSPWACHDVVLQGKATAPDVSLITGEQLPLEAWWQALSRTTGPEPAMHTAPMPPQSH